MLLHLLSCKTRFPALPISMGGKKPLVLRSYVKWSGEQAAAADAQQPPAPYSASPLQFLMLPLTVKHSLAPAPAEVSPGHREHENFLLFLQSTELTVLHCLPGHSAAPTQLRGQPRAKLP